MKKVFIGIDFAKEKFDVMILTEKQGTGLHKVFANTDEGHKLMLSWVKKNARGYRNADLQFCGENTGDYSVPLCKFLYKHKLDMWLESPLLIKDRAGSRKLKNDKVDALHIAEYCRRYMDMARRYEPDSKALETLGLLIRRRELLVIQHTQTSNQVKGMKSVYTHNATLTKMYKDAQSMLEAINKAIKNVEKLILETIESSPEMKANYDRLTSIKGVAFVNASTMIYFTKNFTKFDTANQIANFAGCAPLEHQSGKSLHPTPKVSKYANHRLKSLLTQAAKTAVRFNPKFKAYRDRKIAEGKDKKLVTNNVRSKLIHLMFALIRDKSMYVPNYLNRNKITKVAYC